MLLTAAGFVKAKVEGTASPQVGVSTSLALINNLDFDLEQLLDTSKPENKEQLDLLPLNGC